MAQATLNTTPRLVEHGRNIFIYGHARTNQIIYSLTRQINDTHALSQLPFLGKQTVPSTIRKDLWRPLATVSFPSPPQGLLAFQKLREFRRRHELEWEPSDFRGLSKRARGKKLQDQKANSIADLAAVLGGQAKIEEREQKRGERAQQKRVEREEGTRARLAELVSTRREAKAEMLKAEGEAAEAARTRYRELKKEKMRLQKELAPQTFGGAVMLDAAETSLGAAEPVVPAPASNSRAGTPKQKSMMMMDGIKIEWANVLDAEFAQTWPAAVVHDAMPHGGNRGRHMAASVVKPPRSKTGMEDALGERVTVDQPVVERSSERLVPVEEAAEPPSALDTVLRRLKFGSK